MAPVLVIHARADEIYFKNGDRLSGKISQANPHEIKLTSKVAGEVSFPWKVVERITTDHPLYATLTNGEVLSGTLALRESVVELGSPPAIKTVALKQIQILRSAEEQRTFESMQLPAGQNFGRDLLTQD